MARLIEAWPTPRIASISDCFIPTFPPGAWCSTISEVVGVAHPEVQFLKTHLSADDSHGRFQSGGGSLDVGHRLAGPVDEQQEPHGILIPACHPLCGFWIGQSLIHGPKVSPRSRACTVRVRSDRAPGRERSLMASRRHVSGDGTTDRSP